MIGNVVSRRYAAALFSIGKEAGMAETIVAEVEKSLLGGLDAKTHQKLIDKSLTKVVLQ